MKGKPLFQNHKLPVLKGITSPFLTGALHTRDHRFREADKILSAPLSTGSFLDPYRLSHCIPISAERFLKSSKPCGKGINPFLQINGLLKIDELFSCEYRGETH